MTKNEKRVGIVLAIILGVFVTISLAVPFVKGGVFWLSFVFGILSIAVQVYVLKSAFGRDESPKSKFYGFPIAKIGLIYLIAQLASSIVFMALGFICPIWIPIVVFAAILGAASVGLIAADVTRDEVERQEIKINTDTECMQRLRSMVYPLAGQVSDGECAKILRNLADEFRYSDPVSSEPIKAIEGELTALVEDLQRAVADEEDEAIKSLGRKITITLNERNRVCKLAKKR